MSSFNPDVDTKKNYFRRFILSYDSKIRFHILYYATEESTFESRSSAKLALVYLITNLELG